MEITGACIYCGQMYLLEGDFEHSDEKEINMKASEMCGCIGSRYLKKANYVKAEIKEISENDDEHGVLENAADSVLYGPVKAVFITFEDNKVIKIKKAKGDITISKERKEKRERKL